MARHDAGAAGMEALLGLAALVERHSDELAELESLNVGKPMSLAKEELPICADELRFYAGAARMLTPPRRTSTTPPTRPSSAASRSGSSGRSRLELPPDDGDLEDRAGATGR